MQHLQRSLLQILNFYVTVFLENTLFLWPFWNSVSSSPAGIDFFSWHLEIHMCSEAIEAAEQWNWLANPAQEPDAGTRHFESDIIAD